VDQVVWVALNRSRSVDEDRNVKGARLFLIALGAVLLGACSSSIPTASTSSTTNPETGLPGMYPNFSYPVSDDALPPLCGASPKGHYSSEEGSTHLLRQNGGVVEVTAMVIPRGTWTFAAVELSGVVRDAGNCFYSANVLQRTGHVELVFGFKAMSGPMNPSAVARFLRAQPWVSSVAGA
jgi:hypothetical protein